MKTFRTISSARKACLNAGRPLVLVPTMGALHAGHTSLFDQARNLAGSGGTVVATLFVNPAQFGPKEDLSRYPRPFEQDRHLCKKHGVDILFAPQDGEMYPPGFSSWTDETSVSRGLCGGSRPGHFRGVCTVVLKLFHICQPTDAVFGRKDLQQCAVIGRMVRDLNVPVRLVFGSTVREPDGLALSSRNAYLSPAERRLAPGLYAALLSARQAVRSGERRAGLLLEELKKRIQAIEGARLDYATIVNRNTLEEADTVTQESVAAVAAFFGSTRLIDNADLM